MASHVSALPSSLNTRIKLPPSTPSSRNIVLCFDGTTNTFSSNLTSIPVLYSLLSADPKKQICYYQTGVGTYEPMWTPSGILRALGRLADDAVAWDLPQHVQDGYTFLMQYYQPGDNIFLFGFSRGSFTARALAGMLQQVGLLFPGNEQSVSLAYHIYSTQQGKELYRGGETVAQGFKRFFARDVTVKFVGVFDTVASVGALIPRTLPFAQGTSQIKHFRHALSLDERRARFTPQLWLGPAPSSPTPTGPTHEDSNEFELQHTESVSKSHFKSSSSSSAAVNGNSSTSSFDTTIKEIFFAGSHTDVGGGDFPTDGDYCPRLSHIPLRWMLREAFICGLYLDEPAVKSSPLYGGNEVVTNLVQAALSGDELEKWMEPDLNPHSASPNLVGLVQIGSRRSSYMKKEALAPRGDSLSFFIQHVPNQSLWERIKGIGGRAGQRFKTLFWWLLEILPTLKIYWDPEGNTGRKWTFYPNNGIGRQLPASPIFHSSVYDRLHAPAASFPAGNGMNVPEKKYAFRAKFAKGEGIQDVTFEE